MEGAEASQKRVHVQIELQTHGSQQKSPMSAHLCQQILAAHRDKRTIGADAHLSRRIDATPLPFPPSLLCKLLWAPVLKHAKRRAPLRWRSRNHLDLRR